MNISIPIQTNRMKSFPLILVTVYIVSGLIAFADYFVSDFNVLIAVLLAPFILRVDKTGTSFRYLIPALILIAFSMFLGVRSILFLAFLAAFVFFIDSIVGKTSWTFLWLVFFISPVFRFISMTFGFPIRLFLSKVSGSILLFAGDHVTVNGNIINMNGIDFSVDPECTGLTMVVVSFILTLFIISVLTKKSRRRFSILQICIIMLFTFLLNVFCNLMRIVLLVRFEIMPGTILHDLTGILCLVMYVIIPVYLISNYFLRFSKPEEKINNRMRKNAKAINLILFLSLIFSYGFVDRSIPAKTPDITCQIPGYHSDKLESGVIKLTNDSNLIYIKPLNFYNAEHNPLICWSGSGYEFSSYNEKVIAGVRIYCGIIVKGNQKIYSAWWFDNGVNKTISQIDWRIDAMRSGKLYSLINVNASTEEELMKTTKWMLGENFFNLNLAQGF